MTFLPIAHRELRLASRRKGTFVIRCASALMGTVLAGFALLITLIDPRVGGRYIFNFTSYYLFIVALLGGVFLASDCLSRERREGTLGFLFLTDLKGYDVVLGKFMAISLNAFYGLLATFPALAMGVLAGGVNMSEFGRMSLALLNALFFSVCAAIWVSSRSLSAYRAMSNAIGVVLGLLVLAVFAHVFWTAVPAKWATLLRAATTISPVESFLLATEASYFRQPRPFWVALGVSHLLAWVFLALACWRLPKSISTSAEVPTGFWKRLITGNLRLVRSRRRARLLDIHPVLWLVDDARGTRWVAWALAAVGAALIISFGWEEPTGMIFIPWPFVTLLKLFFAIQACRFFSESRRLGTLELLSITPTATSNILRGQWTALRNNFLGPILLIVASQLTVILMTKRDGGDSLFGSWFFFLYQTPKMIADFFALGWFGMWLALTIKRPELAVGLTLLFVMVLPSFAFCVPNIGTDGVFITVGAVLTIKRLRNASSISY